MTYKAVLGGEGAEEISLLQAVLIIILQAVMAILLAFVFGLVVFFTGLVGMAQLQQIRGRYGAGAASHSPASLTTPFSPPAYVTVADAQKEAVRRYPSLGVKGSRMNTAYVDRYHFYQKTRPSFFSSPSWPLQLADEVANDPVAR